MKSSCMVIGSGSIGERHAYNLMRFFDRDVFVLSRNPSLKFRNNELNESINVKKISKNELNIQDLEILIIATPSSIRSQIFDEFKSININNIYAEVPAAISFHEWQNLKKIAHSFNAKLFAGYNMRFHPGIIKLNSLKEDFISIRSVFGEYLPDLHKWDDYKLRYEAVKELGGGPLLTSHHELDIAIMLMGKVKEVSSFSRNTRLDIGASDHTLVTLFHQNGRISNIDLNFFYRRYTRRMEVSSKDNLIIYEPFSSGLEISDNEKYTFENFDFNQTYVDCLDNIFNQKVSEQISILEIDHLMKVTDACLISSNSNGRIIKV